jgi:hypothetical protein
MEHFAGPASRATSGFAARLAAIAPPPGALTALGLRPHRQRGDLDIHPQQALGEAMMRRLALALAIIPRHPAELLTRLRGTRLQRARQGRWLGTPRPPKGALHRWIEAHGAMALGDGLRATEHASHPLEHFVARAIVHSVLRALDLFPSRGQDTVPPQILA